MSYYTLSLIVGLFWLVVAVAGVAAAAVVLGAILWGVFLVLKAVGV